MKFLNKICLIGAGTFSYQLIQDIKKYKYQIFYNKEKLFLNHFYTEDSRELKKNKKNFYLITVAQAKIKEQIFSQFEDLKFIDAIFIDSSISEKIIYEKNLVVWKSFIGENVLIKKNVYIGPYSIIAKDTIIENNVSIYPRVSILKKSKIGNNVSIGTNSVIMDGVVIEDDCVIGPNKTIYENLKKGSIVF